MAGRRDRLAESLRRVGLLKAVEALPRRPHLMVISYHRIGRRQDTVFDRELSCRRYAGVHCVSDFVRDELVARTGFAGARTVPHFINTTRYSTCKRIFRRSAVRQS